MKIRLALAAIVGVTILGALWIIRQQPVTPPVKIGLRSAPYPMTIGPTTLYVSLSDTDGRPVDGAAVEVTSRMTHAGMLPIVSRPTMVSDGDYQVPVTWPMMGQWTIDVTAALPDGQGSTRDQFVVFIYAIPPAAAARTTQSAYLSQSELNAVMNANPAQELWIVIPQGAQELFMEGQEDDLIPSEIRLQVDGRNTLVIRNNDLVDHNVGPFFVRSGETVRQAFRQPEVFQGTCSIRYTDEISIIVE
jgi:hypothetical protein